jgi:hypothetical protein
MILFAADELDSAKSELFHYLPTLANLPDSSGCCKDSSRYNFVAANVQRKKIAVPFPKTVQMPKFALRRSPFSRTTNSEFHATFICPDEADKPNPGNASVYLHTSSAL